MDTSVLAMCSVKKKIKQAKAESQNTLLAEDDTGASSDLSELLSDLGFHEMESSVQLQR